jgi:transposase InsO family protein
VPLKVITLTDQWLEILMCPGRHGLTVAETCRRYQISRQTFYEYRRRYRDQGLDGLQPRSRRPRSSPGQTPAEVGDLIVAIRSQRPRWGARKIRAELVRRGCASPPAVSTIHQVLRRAGLVGDQGRRRRLAMRRFERPVPNDLWQIDATQVALAGGTRAWVIDILDDHARYAIGARACLRATTSVAWAAMEQAIAEHGSPRQVISDNGLAFTGNRHRRQVLFERNLKALGIQALTSRPAHPQTCGKLERYHQTFKDWYADHGPAVGIAGLQQLLDAFRWHYNVERPHQSLRDATPAEAYQATPKTSPLTGRASDGAVIPPRTVHVNSYGVISYRRRKIGVGMQLAGRAVHVTEDRGLVRVHLGHELLRELLIGPPGSYHGSGKPKGRPRKEPPTTQTKIA